MTLVSLSFQRFSKLLDKLFFISRICSLENTAVSNAAVYPLNFISQNKITLMNREGKIGSLRSNKSS